jgi:hypothetical protein
MGLETGVGMNPEAARRALQAARLTQRVELWDGGGSDNARRRREPGLAALATLGSGWIIGLT